MSTAQKVSTLTKGEISFAGQQKITTPEQAKKVSQDYEAQFLTHMLKDMFAGIETAWGEGHAGEMIKSFWIESMAKTCAQKGMGIGQVIYKELLKKNKIQNGQSYERHV